MRYGGEAACVQGTVLGFVYCKSLYNIDLIRV